MSRLNPNEVPEGIATSFDCMRASGFAETLDFVINRVLPSVDGKPKSKQESETLHKMSEDVRNGEYQILGKLFERKNTNVENVLERLRRHVFISCWTKNASTEDYMWREFGTDGENFNAVRIATTRERMKLALRQNTGLSVVFDDVKYIDFDRDVSSSDAYKLEPYFHKPSVYRGEATPFPVEDEFRIVAFNKRLELDEPSHEKVLLPVDLATLISRIDVSPLASPDYVGQVKSKLLDKGLNSSLLNQPER